MFEICDPPFVSLQSGKTTYLIQVAQICILAHLGVPATRFVCATACVWPVCCCGLFGVRICKWDARAHTRTPRQTKHKCIRVCVHVLLVAYTGQKVIREWNDPDRASQFSLKADVGLVETQQCIQASPPLKVGFHSWSILFLMYRLLRAGTIRIHTAD